MRIRAIRLREAGPFHQPVALEGLSGGFDVLAGPNELGKSTLFRALNVLFTAKHTTNTSRPGDEIVRLRTDGTSAPLIEADFEIAGHLWRLRKQFYARPEAVLTDVTGGVVVRGGDAEAKLEALLVGPSRMGDMLATWRNLLWVQQLGAMTLAPDEAHKVSLQGLIEGEIGAVAEGPGVRAVRSLAEAALRKLVGRNNRPVKGGPLAEALADRDRVREDLASRRAEAGRQKSLQDRLATLRTRQQDVSAPRARAERSTALEAAREAFAASERARSQLAAARHAHAAATARQRIAADALSRFEARCGEHDRLASAIADVEAALAEKKAAGCLSSDRVREAGEAYERAEVDLSQARQAVERFEAQQRRATMVERAGILEHRLHEAQDATDALAAITAELKGNGVTEAGLVNAETLEREISGLEAELKAARPDVRFTYVSGVDGAFKVAGRAISHGEILSADGPLVIDVEGIGRIAISAGASAGIDDLAADLAARRRSLADWLAGAGCNDLQAARQALSRRRKLENEAHQLQSQLATLSPRGLQALVSELAELTPMLAARAESEGPVEGPRERLDAEVVRLAEAERAMEKQRDAALREHGELQSAYRELRSRLATMREQLDRLEAEVPRAVARADQQAALGEALAAAEREASASQRGLDELAPVIADEATHQRLARALAAAEDEVRQADGESRRLALEISRLEGELAASRQGVRASDLAEVETQLADCEARLSRHEDDVAALSLLLEILAGLERESRSRFLAPVITRITPYLHGLFDTAVITLQENLGVEAVVRNGATNSIDRLSTGTQEQISVLVRLGFARLLADRGSSMPVVLDDALVYSDDDRIGRMFSALETASQYHQVIMLTCRSEIAGRFGGTKLALRPWAA